MKNIAVVALYFFLRNLGNVVQVPMSAGLMSFAAAVADRVHYVAEVLNKTILYILLKIILMSQNEKIFNTYSCCKSKVCCCCCCKSSECCEACVSCDAGGVG